MYVDNTLNNQYAIPPVNASKPLKKDTFSSSANTMPITNRAVQEPNVLNKTNNNLYPNFIKRLYNYDQNASTGSSTENFIRSRASFSPTYIQNEIVTRYNMISSIPASLSQIKKVNITA